MKGNFHARFLGGCGRANRLHLPGLHHHAMKSESISSGRRWAIWFSAWAVTLGIMGLLTFPFSLRAPYIVFWFPTGLARLVGYQLDRPRSLVWLCWVPYLALTTLALISRNRRFFFLLFIVLCVILLLNIGGCAVRMHDPPSQPYSMKGSVL